MIAATQDAVFVAHSGRQHSHQLARALEERGLLAEYFTGFPIAEQAIPVWQRRFLKAHLPAERAPIATERVQHCFVAPVVRRLAERFTTPGVAVDFAHRGCAWFDKIAARRVERVKPAAVVCYENSALATFRKARQIGATTVLDAASVHHSWQDKYLTHAESEPAHKRITQRKDAEIELADYILTASEFARESYLGAGKSPDRILTARLGVDTNVFRPQEHAGGGGETRFAFVGNNARVKGLDVLLNAARDLSSRHPGFSLTLFGASRGAVGSAPWLHFTDRLSQPELAVQLAQHQVLVLPSRFDSFGMVVAEAMACGLVVIVSENVGAKELVTPGENGFVVPPDDAEALTAAMRWCLENPAGLTQMGRSARLASQEHDWEHYRTRVATIFEKILADD